MRTVRENTGTDQLEQNYEIWQSTRGAFLGLSVVLSTGGFLLWLHWREIDAWIRTL